MDLILLRHPPPDVAPGVCYGQTDLPVDASTFDATTAAMRQTLATLLGGRVPVAVHSSPLQRARKAAQAIAESFGMPVTEDDRLSEMHFGEWEMQPWDAIDRAQLDAWANDVAGFAPPGGESAHEVARRMAAWAKTALVAKSADATREVHVAVSHAGPIRLHTAAALGLPPTTCLSWALDFGALCALRFSDHGQARLMRWNG
ncbi:alpha-ribazole phosphatase family protein [Pandoraea pneumonica]|uniref:alpha-ribazole phosphatase family protein n=1 Tax=Pandoraea pneumonica TaxID=2508299 RepID=UPI003CFA2598